MKGGSESTPTSLISQSEQATTPRKSTHPRSDFRRAPQVVLHFAGASPCLPAQSVTALPSLNATGCTACHSHMQKRASLMVWRPDPRNTAWTLSPRPQHFPTSVLHGLVHGASVGARVDQTLRMRARVADRLTHPAAQRLPTANAGVVHVAVFGLHKPNRRCAHPG